MKKGKRAGWLRHFKVGDAVLYHGNKAMGRVKGEVVAVRDYQGAVIQWSPIRRGSVMVTDIIHEGPCQHRQCSKATQGETQPQEQPQGETQPQV